MPTNPRLLSLLNSVTTPPTEPTPQTEPPVGEDKQTIERRLVAGLIAMLEEGTNPWQKPWAYNGSRSPHKNLVSGHVFTGSNPGWLHFWSLMGGFTTPLWLTFAQGRSRGWFPIKGNKACSITVPLPVTTDKKDENGEVVTDDNGDPVKVSFQRFKHSAIFNACQMQGDGLQDAIDAELAAAPTEPLTPEALLQRGEEAINPWRPWIVHGPSDRAFYSPRVDRISMPMPQQFHSIEGYYATALHELAHFSGAGTRLAREGVVASTGFGTPLYAREELIAELASFLMCYRLDIPNKVENHASYLQSWVKCLKEDPKILMSSMQKATKAADYILDAENAKPKGDD